jgi:hypothetical protein
MSWILVEKLATKQNGKPLYYRGWTPIGPRCTEDIKEAEKFETKFDAWGSRAYSFSLTFFEPEEVKC